VAFYELKCGAHFERCDVKAMEQHVNSCSACILRLRMQECNCEAQYTLGPHSLSCPVNIHYEQKPGKSR
jgi:hypothetical protein